MRRSFRYLEAGDVGGAMKSAAESQIHAHAIQLQENNNAVIQGTTKAVMQQLVPLLGNTVQSLGGQNAAALFTSLATESSAGALTQSQTSAPSPPPAQEIEIDPKDPSTWPDDPSWIVNRRPLLTLNKNPRTLVDLYNDWNFGYLNWPALRHLEEIPARKMAAEASVIRPRRGAYPQSTHQNTLADAETLHRELCGTSNSMNRVEDLSTCSGRSCGNSSMVLRPRTAGFAQRSADRRRRMQTAASSSAAASAPETQPPGAPVP